MNLLLGLCAALTPFSPRRLSPRATTPLFSVSQDVPLFSFGFCADVQYVDAPDDTNFQKTRIRRYHQSLRILQEAVQVWDECSPSFSILLGDMVDGKTKLLKNEDKCLNDVLSVVKTTSIPFHYVCGNHEHYAFNRVQIYSKILEERQDCSPSQLYYSFSPDVYDSDGVKTNVGDKYRFICLDAYDTSLIGASSEETLAQARAILAEKNPNDLLQGGAWFNNLERENYRYVPYNGGLSPKQLDFLQNELISAGELSQKVVIFCHQPIHAPKKPQSLLWNSEEIKDILKEYGSRYNPPALLWMAGHDHGGDYHYEEGDGYTAHHLIPPAPIECEEGGKAYGTMQVFEDRFEMKFTGDPPRHLQGDKKENDRFWPSEFKL